MTRLNLAFLHSRIRVEEKLLIEALQTRQVTVKPIDIRDIVFDPQLAGNWKQFDLILDRCIAHGQALAVTAVLECMGCTCVNRLAVTRLCGNKLETSLALIAHGVPTLPIRLAVSPESALLAIEELGYPVVLKPVTGSWGRLLAKINDRDAAEAVLEHKSVLGSVQHHTFYVQPFVRKRNFDIRVFVIGGETICAVKRTSDHWITNTARGATTSNYPLSDALTELCNKASAAVGGGVLAIDVFETEGGELLVNEINSTMEFRNSIAVTGVNIPDRFIDYLFVAADHAHSVASSTEAIS